MKLNKMCFFISMIFVLLLFQGCLNVNLKSVLPNQTYYSLDNIKLSSVCKHRNHRYGLNVSVLSPFDGKDILIYNDKQEIKILENYKWIDLPKNMVRNAFIKVGLNNCMQIEQNPPLSQRISTIRVSINEMYLKNNGSENEAHIYLAYEVMGYDMRHIKDGIIQTNANNINPAIALQEAMNKAINRVIKEVS